MGTVLWIWNKGQAAVVGLAWLPVVCVCVCVCEASNALHYIARYQTQLQWIFGALQGKTSRIDMNLQNNFDPLKVLLARDWTRKT